MAVVRGVENTMSEVFSFRLRKDNPREAKAIEIINRWREDGFSLRHTLIEAVFSLESQHHCDKTSIMDGDVERKIIHLLKSLLEQPELITKNKIDITDSFVVAMKKSAKPGLKIN